jgi:protein-S-isoprenylcysteine O-methyltransferase Ste14
MAQSFGSEEFQYCEPAPDLADVAQSKCDSTLNHPHESPSTTGPYRFVRHAGYVGGLVGYLATPLALGALWVLVPSMLTVVALVIRTALEDRTLQAELPGYAEYTRRTRYRLLPGVW